MNSKKAKRIKREVFQKYYEEDLKGLKRIQSVKDRDQALSALTFKSMNRAARKNSKVKETPVTAPAFTKIQIAELQQLTALRLDKRRFKTGKREYCGKKIVNK